MRIRSLLSSFSLKKKIIVFLVSRSAHLQQAQCVAFRFHLFQDLEFEGTVKYMSEEKGYGFIECQVPDSQI